MDGVEPSFKFPMKTFEEAEAAAKWLGKNSLASKRRGDVFRVIFVEGGFSVEQDIGPEWNN